MIPLWPDMSAPAGTLERVGRVLFWIGVLFATPALLLGVAGLFSEDGGVWALAICGTIAVVFYGLGRAAIYILADE